MDGGGRLFYQELRRLRGLSRKILPVEELWQCRPTYHNLSETLSPPPSTFLPVDTTPGMAENVHRGQCRPNRRCDHHMAVSISTLRAYNIECQVWPMSAGSIAVPVVWPSRFPSSAIHCAGVDPSCSSAFTIDISDGGAAVSHARTGLHRSWRLVFLAPSVLTKYSLWLRRSRRRWGRGRSTSPEHTSATPCVTVCRPFTRYLSPCCPSLRFAVASVVWRAGANDGMRTMVGGTDKKYLVLFY